jgi:purine-binding chemotaxis protein CheW
MVDTAHGTKDRQFCTFFLEGLFFGVEVQKVQEVICYQEMTRVPLASRVIQGLINLRGQIVTAIDLRRRLELNDRKDGQLPMNVVIRTDDGAVSLLVDEIGDVLEVDMEHFERAPETIRGIARELISGVYKLNERLLLVLDTEKAVDTGPGGDAVLDAEA